MVDGQRLKDIVQVQVVHLQAQLIVGIMRYRALDLYVLVLAATRQVIDRHHAVVNAHMALLDLPNGIVEHQLGRMDVDIGLETTL